METNYSNPNRIERPYYVIVIDYGYTEIGVMYFLKSEEITMRKEVKKARENDDCKVYVNVCLEIG